MGRTFAVLRKVRIRWKTCLLRPASVLAINVGSSSIKFAVYSAAPQLTSLLQGQLDRVGLDGTTLSWTAGPDRPSGAWTLRTARSRQDC